MTLPPPAWRLCCPLLSWGDSSPRPWAGVLNPLRPGLCCALPRPLPNLPPRAHSKTLAWPKALRPASCLPSRWNDPPHPDLPGKLCLSFETLPRWGAVPQCSHSSPSVAPCLPLCPPTPSNVHFLEGLIPVPWGKCIFLINV